MKQKRKALLEFLKAMGASVREFQDHAMITFDREDSVYNDFLRKTIYDFIKVERAAEWVSDNPYSGELSW